MAIQIRIAGYQDEKSVHTRAVRVMIRALLEKTGGRVGVDFERNIAERGRRVVDLLDLVKSGEFDLCYFSSSYLSKQVPSLGILDIPFQFSERQQTRIRLEGRLGAILKEAISTSTDFEVLAFWDNGVRNISNRKRSIRAPEDCRGLRIRTLPSEGYHATFRAMGMEPVSIDVAEMMQAIASGTVDAQENPLTNIRLFGIQQFHPFVAMTGHFHGIALVLCNARSWANWPEDVRSGLSQAMSESTAAQWRCATDDERECRSVLEAQGIDIVDLDEASRLAFKQAVRHVIEDGCSSLPQDVSGFIDGADMA